MSIQKINQRQMRPEVNSTPKTASKITPNNLAAAPLQKANLNGVTNSLPQLKSANQIAPGVTAGSSVAPTAGVASSQPAGASSSAAGNPAISQLLQQASAGGGSSAGTSSGSGGSGSSSGGGNIAQELQQLVALLQQQSQQGAGGSQASQTASA